MARNGGGHQAVNAIVNAASFCPTASALAFRMWQAALRERIDLAMDMLCDVL